MKIAFYGVRPEEKAQLERLIGQSLPQMTVTYSEERNLLKAVERDAEVISVFIDSKVDREVLDAFPALRFIAARSTGFDHIDLKETAKRGILVSNVPRYGEHTVAEFAFALLLGLSRKLYSAVQRVKEQGDFSTEGLRGFDLMGKTMGIVGTGHIGRYAVNIALGFGMKVLAYDVCPDAKLASQLGFSYVALEDLLRRSDVVSLHVPYGPTTHHLMDQTTLSQMKPTAVLINTSRGGVVDTMALMEALTTKKIAGAGLDVVEEEGAIQDEAAFLTHGHAPSAALATVLENHVLMKMPNVLITPHMAFKTDEALQRILETTMENILAWSQGHPRSLVAGAEHIRGSSITPSLKGAAWEETNKPD